MMSLATDQFLLASLLATTALLDARAFERTDLLMGESGPTPEVQESTELCSFAGSTAALAPFDE